MLIPTVVEQTSRGGTRLRHLPTSIKRPDYHVVRWSERSNGQLCHCTAAFSGCSGFWKRISTLYINSPGGVITSGLAMLDTMNLHQVRCANHCNWDGGIHGLRLIIGGTKGKRFGLPNSTILDSSAFRWWQGQQTEIEIATEEILKTRKKMNQIFGRCNWSNGWANQEGHRTWSLWARRKPKIMALIDDIWSIRTTKSKFKGLKPTDLH